LINFHPRCLGGSDTPAVSVSQPAGPPPKKLPPGAQPLFFASTSNVIVSKPRPATSYNTQNQNPNLQQAESTPSLPQVLHFNRKSQFIQGRGNCPSAYATCRSRWSWSGRNSTTGRLPSMVQAELCPLS
jgi:hypothetical protein